MAETEKKPFWMDNDEWEKRHLPKLEGDVSAAVTGGVPDLKWVEKGAIIGAWVIKDGLLLYHFYKKDRKEIFDQAHKQMEGVKDAALQQEIATQANASLEKLPWWPNFKDVLESVFKEHFRFHPFKSDYYQEVDSWSVVMAEPSTPVRWTAAQYELPFSKVALQVGS